MIRFNVLTGDTSVHEPPDEKAAFKKKPRGFSKQDASGHTRTHERPDENNARNNPFDLSNSHVLTPLLQPPEFDKNHPSKPLIRAISNKFPVLKEGALCKTKMELPGTEKFRWIRKSMPAIGKQEVIIQHWRYNICQALSSQEECMLLWKVLQQRAKANVGPNYVRYIQIMENHGIRSGASLPHSHSQLLALPFVPGDQRHRLELAIRQYERLGRQQNPFDDAIKEARDSGRILFENLACAAFVPYGLDKSYEIWIVSKCDRADSILEEPRIDLFAECSRQALKMLYQERDDPPYNLIVRQSAMNDVDAHKWYRWHAVILPHNVQSTWAGIKGYGNFVPMTGTPEDHAAYLRKWLHTPFAHTKAETSQSQGCSSAGPSPHGRYMLAATCLAFFATAFAASKLAR